MTEAKVVHKAFGEGNVISCADGYIRIRFAAGEKMFPFLRAFDDGFLSTEVPEILAKLDQLRKAAREEQARLEEAARKAEEERQAELARQEELSRIAAERIRAESASERATRNHRPQGTNLAFKCNYNNGGRNEKRIGFFGVCSDDVIWHNIEVEKRVWCTQPECPCMRYYQGLITRKELDEKFDIGNSVCIESDQLRSWRTSAGMHHNGPRKGLAMKLLHAGKDCLAVLTTRFPGEKEQDRVIFAVFLVDDFYEGNDREDGFVTAKPVYRISLNLGESRGMLFWRYFANANDPARPAWSSGLHRYITDTESVQILRDIARIKKDTMDKALAGDFLKHYCQLHGMDPESVPEPSGALSRR